MLLKDAFQVLITNMALVYPFLLFILLLQIILSKDPKLLLTLDPMSFLFIGILFLLLQAFNAGWYKMIYLAVLNTLMVKPLAADADMETGAARSLGEGAEKKPDLQKVGAYAPFRTFKAFFPGVGQFFMPFAVSGLLQILTLAVVFLGITLAINAWVPHFDKLMTFIQEQSQSTAPIQPAQALLSLPKYLLDEYMTMAQIILIATILGGLLSLMVCFTAPLLMTQMETNPFKAYWRSIRQFIKDPLRIVLIGLFISFLWFALNYLSLISAGSILIALWQFLILLLLVYSVILLFVYLVRYYQKDNSPDTLNISA